jgi:hypothetical protein
MATQKNKKNCAALLAEHLYYVKNKLLMDGNWESIVVEMIKKTEIQGSSEKIGKGGSPGKFFQTKKSTSCSIALM